ncbi:MAG: GNAT family N-acetyltransferase [Pseudomonadota bacterium]
MVREAISKDLPLAAELMGQLWTAHGFDDHDDSYRRSRTQKIMETCDCYLVGDPPIAFAALQDIGDHMLIRQFCLDASHRGQGKGRAVFEALKNHAFPDRSSRLFAHIGNAASRKFWEKMGYSAFAYAMEREAEVTK